MKILLIFENRFDLNRLKKKIVSLNAANISILALTSERKFIASVNEACLSIIAKEGSIDFIESAELINNEVDNMRSRIFKWSADLGAQKVGAKSLIEWFMLPCGGVSSWWFSLVSEKNTLETDVYFRIAQLQAIDKVVLCGDYDLCIFSSSDYLFSKAVKNLCHRHELGVYVLLNPTIIRINGYLSNILTALSGLAVYALKTVAARLYLGSVNNRVKRVGESTLLVSYFPAVDKKAAEKGFLKNRYAVPLQEKLAQMSRKIVWLWMYVPLDGNNYIMALRFVKKFHKGGEINFLLQEFLSFKILFKALFAWVRQVGIFKRLRRAMPKSYMYENLSIPESHIFIDSLMMRSFAGWTAMKGILYFELYKNVFAKCDGIKTCLYYSEMLAWEKALCAAKKIMAPEIKTIGFVHSSMPANLFSYFYHPTEMSLMPLPDHLACGGDIIYDLARSHGYQNAVKVESVRYLYLNDYLADEESSCARDNIVMIAGSIKESETKALISIFNEAFPKPEGFQIWLKGHPYLPFDNVLRSLNIDIKKSGYVIKNDPIENLLKHVKILVVGDSAVAIEALAASCKVIIPIFSDIIFMSPLKGFEKYYSKVTNPAELSDVIKKCMNCGETEYAGEAKKFVSEYWCLDPELKKWEELFSGANA
jgi:surface carbohydrate biosynthesis protein (TIGR04326 family)